MPVDLSEPLKVKCGWCGQRFGEVRAIDFEQGDAIRRHYGECKNPGDGLIPEHPLHYYRDSDDA